MNFAIAVHGAPYASAASRSACRFAAAALDAGHAIERIFFYHEGVRAGQASQIAPQDEADLLKEWRNLQQEHKLELAVCIASAIKRGLLDDNERDRYEANATTLDEHFTIVGLGQLIDAVIHADRYVEFS